MSPEIDIIKSIIETGGIAGAAILIMWFALKKIISYTEKGNDLVLKTLERFIERLEAVNREAAERQRDDMQALSKGITNLTAAINQLIAMQGRNYARNNDSG